jgi:integrase
MFTERRNTSVKPETAEWRQLARSLAAVQLEALARADERDEGDLTGEPKLPVLRHDTPADVLPISGDKARILCAESKLPLSQILPRMHAEKRNLRDSTKAEQRVAVRMFEEFLGEPTPVYKISRRTMIDYKNALLQTPSNYLTRFKGKSLPQAIEANKRRKEPFPILSVTTINGKWLTHVGSIFQWAANNGFLPDNPCQHVRVDEGKSGGEPSRVPFTADDLAKIFGHPSFADPVAYDEREWAVLIALFTGMRGGEIAQLTLEGIKRERGELVFTVGGKLKNEGSRRIVPVHSTLSALGLERRIERLRKTGKTFLFPEWYARAEEIMTNAARKGHTTQSAYAEVIPKAFNRFLLKQVEITDTRKVFHSFRHTFKTSLSHAGVSREVNDVLTGHHDNSAGAGYVHDISIDRMKKAIEKLHFDVRLPICDMKTAAGF